MSYVLALALLALCATPAAAQLYRYTDEHGDTYVTNDPNAIPERYRQGMTFGTVNPRGTAKLWHHRLQRSGTAAVAEWLQLGTYQSQVDCEGARMQHMNRADLDGRKRQWYVKHGDGYDTRASKNSDMETEHRYYCFAGTYDPRR